MKRHLKITKTKIVKNFQGNYKLSKSKFFCAAEVSVGKFCAHKMTLNIIKIKKKYPKKVN